jgi:2-polyprenyl-3-methyl-5-hydroxy-6-metoxy-1,4-benzoquinol methylase
LHFEKQYFEDLRYSHREDLIKKHVLEVLRWGARSSGANLLDGKGKTALDVGCAYGYGVSVLRSLGYLCNGTDISKYSLLHAQRTNSSADFAIGDIQTGLPFKLGAFDLVTCFEVLEHVRDPMKAAMNMLDVCKDVMICTTPNRAVEKPVKSLVRDFDQTHISTRTPREWEKDLRKHVHDATIRVESFYDSNLLISKKLLFFRSFKVPYIGLDTRILIKKTSVEKR